MYSTCIFCHSDLGKNESIEHFPIGHRLAFDEARGRLWVVCRRCERWNLTPLEERWEAIEECERAFRSTKLRVSTDNIGLARLRDGTELVRIGAPQRPEMAAWRYGDQFGRRRKRYMVYTGAAVVAGAGIVLLGPVTGIIAGSSWGLWNVASTAHSLYQQHRVRARLNLFKNEAPVPIRRKQLGRIALVDDEGEWALRVPYELPNPETEKFSRLRPWNRLARIDATTIIHGPDALIAAGKLLPAINASGATRNEVSSAVEIIEDTPSPEQLFSRYAIGDSPLNRRVQGRVLSPEQKLSSYFVPTVDFAGRRRALETEGGHVLMNLPKDVRLALEMATHEESERRALEGELSVLEDAWKEAEEIAAIADDMFVPDETREQLEALKEGEGRKRKPE
ncbi:MAG TPA: hypothetical protein VGM50_10275 [Gemmatimonadaceae bacterium]